MFFDGGERGFAHIGLDGTALAVECIELMGNRLCACGVIGNQTFNTQRHIGEPPGGIQAWAHHKTQVIGTGTRGVTPAHAQQRCNARMRTACAYALQALIDENAIVFIEAHHIGDGAQRHQVQ